MADSAQTLIMLALAEVGRGMGLADDQILIERGVEIDQEYEGSFLALEMTDVDSEFLGERLGRDPKRAVMRHDLNVAVLLSFYAADDAEVHRLKNTVLVDFANGVANSKGLRALSFNFRLAKQRFYRGLDSQERIVLRAACQVNVVYRAYANDSAVAIQPQ